ncbi:MAG TPA: alcohol dehydrogenase catalytic domain-containing protein [Trebonia sp.]|nr:alcohol dehydrogenase catalytic domain-containing protein [Trebonia sp.]
MPQMRLATLDAPEHPLSLAERPVQEPGPGEILVKVIACGMCFSEVNLLHGDYPFARFPVIPGHEITGTVAALGAGVDWPAVGTQVGAQFLHHSDGHCHYCVRGDQILCPNKRITGVAVDGGYAEYFLGRAGFVTPLPEGLDPVAGAPLMCAGITAFNGLRQAGVRPTSRVAVIGAGGVGSLAVRFAVAMGARVTVIGRSATGAQAAEALGAERYVATSDQDPSEALRAWDGGADVIVNSAPSTSAAVAAYGGLAPDGTLLLLGYSAADPLTVPTGPMVINRLHVMANPSGSPHDLRDTLAFAAGHQILPEVIPVKLDQAPDTLAAMAAGTAPGPRRVIVF